MTLARLFGVAATVAGGLIAGNYLYQWFNDGNWGQAFERSYFQLLALFLLSLALYVTP